MKIKIGVFVCILMLFVAPILFAEDNRKEIPVEDAMKALCGTWLLEGGPEDRLVYSEDGKYGWYYPKMDIATYRGDFKIGEAWQDSEGNVWLTLWHSHRRSWKLQKISNNGTVREGVKLLDRDPLSIEIGPNESGYMKAIRKKND